MADDNQTLRSIDYRAAFPFTHIFRSFRIAVHPSKLLLALALLLVMYVGGRILDGIWFAKHSAVPGEIALYAGSKTAADFTAARDQLREQIINDYAARLRVLGSDKPDLKTDEDRKRAAAGGRFFGEYRAKLYELRERNLDAPFAVLQGNKLTVGDAESGREVRRAIDDSYNDNTLTDGLQARLAYFNAVRAAERAKANDEKQPNLTADQRKAIDERFAEAKRNAEKARDEAIAKAKTVAENRQKEKPDELNRDRKKFSHDMDLAHTEAMVALYAQVSGQLKQASRVRGEGIFMAFLEYQVAQVDGVVQGVVSGNFLVAGGVIDRVWNFLTVGTGWLITQHPFYAIIFIAFFLSLWSVFGGAICRIAAVQAARDEKISVRAALRFSTGKFLSFLSAPLIPLLVLLVIGLVVAAGGFVGNIPVIGPIIIGAVFFLALIAGLLMTLVLFGTIGGFNLMYPTIAAEGSDSFDAISRSFSYLYARPWRLAFYTLVAIVYGALTYLFVRYFLYVMLSLTHYWVDVGLWVNAENAAELWSTLWRKPDDLFRLSHDLDFSVLGTFEGIGAFLLAVWIYIAIAMLGAYAISFYFSANTVIYFLMRKEVDATELDDVYVEPTEDEMSGEPLPQATTSAPAAAGASTTPPTVVQTPADNPPPAST